MGVMECNRTGCNNILCDRHSTRYGYICNECFDELVDLGPATDVDHFMHTPKKEDSERNIDISYEFFNYIFSK